MKALDLSNIKVVGFIPNFNPKQGYPEYGLGINKKAVKPSIVIPEKEPKVLTKEQRGHQIALKNAKKSFNKTAASKRKPELVASFKAY